MPMPELRGRQLKHVFASVEEGAACRVINARLGAVEALEGALLARERADVGGVTAVEGLDEARVGELAVDGDALTEGNGQDGQDEENAAGEGVLLREREGGLGREVEHNETEREER